LVLIRSSGCRGVTLLPAFKGASATTTTSTLNAPTHPLSDALLHRAKTVIPKAMYSHRDARRLWPGAPQFVSRTSGWRIWDADGHEYVDLLCSWGPIIHCSRMASAAPPFVRTRPDLPHVGPV